MSADLITVEELKIALGDDLLQKDDAKDKKYLKAIQAASAAIRKFCDRSFGTTPVIGVHTYDFDESGYLDIDDAFEVIKLTLVIGTFSRELETAYWHAEPVEGPPYTYLRIPRYTWLYSPQMGFRQNLDVITKDRGYPFYFPMIKVEAKWGSPDIPDDVRQAAIWTAAKFQEKPDQRVSESIANYSYTSQLRGEGPPPAIPSDAQDLLAPYVRFQI